eukprot:NODE_13_length_54415_cov_0.522424.p42 type:complete len:132 gc:universal NODE_13_length_54415_cov_0.522424:9667-9272(-)
MIKVETNESEGHHPETQLEMKDQVFIAQCKNCGVVIADSTMFLEFNENNAIFVGMALQSVNLDPNDNIHCRRCKTQVGIRNTGRISQLEKGFILFFPRVNFQISAVRDGRHDEFQYVPKGRIQVIKPNTPK